MLDCSGTFDSRGVAGRRSLAAERQGTFAREAPNTP